LSFSVLKRTLLETAWNFVPSMVTVQRYGVAAMPNLPESKYGESYRPIVSLSESRANPTYEA
jgi:hypothetical protein